MDWNWRVGDITQLLGYVGLGIVVFMGLQGNVKLIAQRLGFLTTKVEEQSKRIEMQSRELARFGELLEKMARYEERHIALHELFKTAMKEIDRLKDDMKGLRHGEGFIGVNIQRNHPKGGS